MEWDDPLNGSAIAANMNATTRLTSSPIASEIAMRRTTSGGTLSRKMFTPVGISSEMFGRDVPPFLREVLCDDAPMAVVRFVLAAEKAALIDHVARDGLVNAPLFHE